MATSVEYRPSRTRAALAVVLTVLILVPAGYLFFRVWQSNADARDNTKLETQGVEFLQSMAPLISALAESETSALAGVSAEPASLTTAVAQVSEADQRVGDALLTHERWAGLRDRIAKLPTVAGDAITVFQTHVEVSDLALALYDSVRINSTLIRDPDNDLSNLQQAVAIDLPNTVVQVNRMGDLATMLTGVTGAVAQRQAQTAVIGPQFGAAIQQVRTAVASLTDHLQAAVDDTHSPSLSGSLVTSLDAFRRGVEALTRGANPTGAPSPAAMTTAQSSLQTSLAGLSKVTLSEMGKLLDDRQNRLDNERLEALIAAGLAVLLVIIALAVRLGGRRRATVAPVPNAGRQPGSEPGYSSFIDQPPYGRVNPTRRERSGALR
jgi:hypothetical protein